MANIHIINEVNKERAEMFAEKIRGQSYMDFDVVVAPIGGSFAVTVNTDYTDDIEDATGMLMYLMYLAMTD